MRQLLAPYTLVILSSDEGEAPPFVSLERDRTKAEAEALAWARDTFGERAYRVTGGQSVTTATTSRWSTAG